MIPWYLLLLLVLSLYAYADVTRTSACCFSKVLEGATMNVQSSVLLILVLYCVLVLTHYGAY